MRFVIPVLLLLLLLPLSLSAALAPKVSDENNGEAPAFKLKIINKDDKEISLSDFKGKPIVLNFFASWCPPCGRQIAELTKVYEDLSDKGLVMIGAAADAKILEDTKPEAELVDVKDIIKERKIPYLIGIATKDLTKDYKFKGIPTTIFIDRSGKIVKTFYGFHEKADFADTLKQIMADVEEKKK
jgi:peroxiredoxin